MKNRVQFEDVMIFRNEFNGRWSYSLGISGKKFEAGRETDERITSYINLQFRRDNEPDNKQRIDIVEGFMAPYPGKNGKNGVKIVVQRWQPHEEVDGLY